MKINLHPMFTGLSGALGNIVYVTLGKEMVDGKVIRDSYTYAKQKGVRTAPTSIEQDNIVAAFSIVINRFNLLKVDTAAYQTWQDQADYYEQSLGRYTTAYQLFMSYYMTKYNSTLADRTTRIWS